MIIYPEKSQEYKDCDITSSSYVGKVFNIEDKLLTCIHIDGDKYIFSFNELALDCKYTEIKNVLKELYTTGGVEGNIFFSQVLLNQIDFFFIPTEYQMFGNNFYANECEEDTTVQFDYYKKGNFNKIKHFQGDSYAYWLSNKSTYNNAFCLVDRNGYANGGYARDLGGVPIFFQVTKRKSF